MLSREEQSKIIGELVIERGEREIRMEAAKVKLVKIAEDLKFIGNSLSATVHQLASEAARGRDDATRRLESPISWDDVRKAHADYLEEFDRLAEINASLKQMGLR